MKMDNWHAKDMPLHFLALKLCEEAAEVGKVITDTVIVENGEYIGEVDLGKSRVRELREELAHVNLIVAEIKRRIR